MSKIKVKKLLKAIILCEGVGILSSFVTLDSIKTWYPLINKPTFNPPAFIFGPVWTILYFLMGISLYLVWQKSKTTPIIFWVQLILNALWSFLFFGLHSPVLALIDIIALLISIILTMKTFYKISKASGLILVPYLFWVLFAAILNFSIWRLN